ncbi:tyrosine-type recombinase/integrase [Pararhodobacter oceanensis]|uniref:Integrase n=1 Tax=Pararhodobacter oceanensis TaxID=2172121 RepID=A0A2T8HQK0_9RHOB|nr:integrase arm-type DNA-binding domain-containing protein [Pararhodobacter oceanensis]PVH27727.1 integrase [Pararhodobacter oceanensis]
MPLTDTQIRNLGARNRPYKVSDMEGLFLLVKPTGSRLWQMKYRFEGKEKLLSFGAYPSVSLASARRLRDQARALLASGEDPSAVKKEQKRKLREANGDTFAKFADAYIVKARKENKAPATMSKTVWLLGLANADLGNIPISDITSPVVLACLRKVEAKGNYETAKRLRAIIGAVFRLAIATGAAEIDPTYALRDALITPTVKHRAAITDPATLGGLLRAIDGFHGQTTTKIALQFLALVAQRPGEVRSAKWEHIDFANAVWSIPAEQMKMRRPHKVPLPPQALALLDELRRLTGNGVYLFPSLRTHLRPISENTLNGALRRMGISGDEMTAHGFRASFSTIANESGLWHPDSIERALAHVESNQVRRAYDRGQHWEERLRLADWWAGFLGELRAT